MRNKGELTFKNMVDINIPVFNFDGEWLKVFGKPQRTGVWYIYGNSGHGKTTFILMLIKKLANYGKILFLPYEEGGSSIAMKNEIKRIGLLDVNRQVSISIKTIKELNERLSMKRSPDIIVVDSLDASEFKRPEQVVDIKNRFKNKLFIFTGWAKGKEPAKRIGENILFLANQKIWVEGYRAFSRGRSLGEDGYFTIWEEGAMRYWEFK